METALLRSNRNGSIAILPILLVSLLILGLVIFFKINSSSTKSNSFGNGSGRDTKQTEDNGMKVLAPIDPGWVCAPEGDFSFRLNVRSSPLSEGNGAIVLTTKSGVLLVSKKGVDPETVLKKHNISYTTENGVLIYQLTSSLDSSLPAESPISAMTKVKNDFIMTIFYDLNSQEQAVNTLKIIGDSIKEGCKNV